MKYRNRHEKEKNVHHGPKILGVVTAQKQPSKAGFITTTTLKQLTQYNYKVSAHHGPKLLGVVTAHKSSLAKVGLSP